MSFALARRLFVFVSLAGYVPAHGQCYDLSATRLYEARSRFVEDWDRPIWNAKPGEGNFHIENEGYGRAHQFAIFTVGLVRKTPQGWVPYRASRTPLRIRCAHNANGSGILCYNPAYEPVPEDALIHIGHDKSSESWSLSAQGVLSYRHSVRGRLRLIENRSPRRVDPRDFRGEAGTQEDTATLDLNTGVYRYEQRGTCDGCYGRRFKNGLKLRRTITFAAQARLKEVACPASLPPGAIGLTAGKRSTNDIDKQTRGVCAVRVKETLREGWEPMSGKWEFLQNPFGQTSPDGCVLVFEAAVADAQAAAIAGKDSSKSEVSAR
ncbi:MAG: hypothetical protein JNL98_02780 [Bryobacterales bacterium]|nr:hypothetical protein [Bryobacterales bacterium]